MELFLGIDGGQSSTTVLIGDSSGRVIGWARGGPCNHVSGPGAAEKFTRVIKDCIAEAGSIAGLTHDTLRFKAACCGMSGGPVDKESLLREIIMTELLVVKTDAEIALTGAFAGLPGIVVIAGTGSIALGRNGSGEMLRAGGWGYIYGDEGSAFDIVRQSVRAALRQEEGWGTKTALLPELLSASQAVSANELMHDLYTSDWPRWRVAELAALVDQVGLSGDSVARGILEQAGQNLASLAGCLRRVLFAESSTVDVAFVGGVFRSKAVLSRFRLLVELTEGCRCMTPLMDPAAGALLDAYQSAGRSPTLSGVPGLK